MRHTRGDLFICQVLVSLRSEAMDEQKSAEGIVAIAYVAKAQT